MKHEIVRFPNGSASLRPIGARESMHSEIGPEHEAAAVYVEQSGMRERLAQGPVVLYDVGMGIAANAMAAIRVARESSQRLEIHSFENATDGLRLALEHPEEFPFLKGREARDLLAKGVYEEARVRWVLHEGDFFESLAVAAPDIVFYDFYSPAEDSRLWGFEAFSRLRAVCAPEAMLVTYCSSTAARSPMMLSGWSVERGAGTPAKRETTLARTSGSHGLGAQWIEHLRRSGKPFPNDLPFSHEEAFQRIECLLTK